MAREWGRMTRALTRRLDRLEEHMQPAEEPRIWQVVFFDSNGGRTEGPQVAWRRGGKTAPGLVDSRNRIEGDSQTARQA